jgi:hypothetical protein
MHASFKNILGKSFGGYVDWFAVEDLGAVGNYLTHKNEQAEKHGVPEKQAKKVAAKEAVLAEVKALALATEKASWFQVSVDLKVQKITREELKKVA